MTIRTRVRLADATDDPAHPVVAAAAAQLAEYFAGERTDFDLPLDPVGTEFQRSAWEALRTIPYGTTVSYGEQAERMGDRRKARAVGAANGRNPISIIVPCHRVVGANGALTGFAGGIDTKAWLLARTSRLSHRGSGTPDVIRRGCGRRPIGPCGRGRLPSWRPSPRRAWPSLLPVPRGSASRCRSAGRS